MRPLALLALAACAAQPGDLVDENGCAVQAGRCAPDFTLPDSTGASLSLSDLRGQRVIVLGTALW